MTRDLRFCYPRPSFLDENRFHSYMAPIEA